MRGARLRRQVCTSRRRMWRRHDACGCVGPDFADTAAQTPRQTRRPTSSSGKRSWRRRTTPTSPCGCSKSVLVPALRLPLCTAFEGAREARASCFLWVRGRGFCFAVLTSWLELSCEGMIAATETVLSSVRRDPLIFRSSRPDTETHDTSHTSVGPEKWSKL